MVKELSEQVVVLVGASSGIGRETARQLGEKGATVVLAARNGDALREVADEVRELGGQAHVVVTDVAEWGQVQNLASEAVERFGRIDTWINDAAIAVYATVEGTSVTEFDRVMDVNYMGQVHGIKAALPVMLAQGYGTIINVGSVESYRALPYHGAYTASKHAVKGLTDALRLEMEHEKTGVEVVGIFPASVNTPFFSHARSRLGTKPAPPQPVYTPESVAAAIVSAAARPQRDVYVGGGSKLMRTLEFLSPRLTDRFMRTGGMMFRAQKSGRPDDGRDNFYEPMRDIAGVHGEYEAKSRPSVYTRVFEITPRWARVAVPALIAGAAGLMFLRRQ